MSGEDGYNNCFHRDLFDVGWPCNFELYSNSGLKDMGHTAVCYNNHIGVV
jgi:hypothetical protein